MYEKLLRPVLFRMDPEDAHHFTLSLLASFPALGALIRGQLVKPAPIEVAGIRFPNPIGLAAGMDKNALALSAWEKLGFGFAEIGTVTLHPQPGNPRPRLVRFPNSMALVNRMGFNNDGAEAIARRLEGLRSARKWPLIPVGINLGKSKVTPNEEAAEDYLGSFRLLSGFADYVVVNVSSPNTPGLRELQEADALRRILGKLKNAGPSSRIFLKLAPDLSAAALRAAAQAAEEENCSGLIATNTALDRSRCLEARGEPGGLSGAPILQRSLEVVGILRASCDLPIIGCGGIADADSAARMRAAGASLIQLYTGFVYRGPRLIHEAAQAFTD